MADKTLRQALTDIADAIRAKGITGTMSALEMPSKIASIPSGGASTKYGVSIDGMLGDVDNNGVLQPPSDTITFISKDIKSLVAGSLQYKFAANGGLTSVNLPALVKIGYQAMTSMCNGCTSLASVNLPSLRFSEQQALSYAFANCSALTSLDLGSLEIGYGMDSMFEYATGFTGGLSLPKLVAISDHGMQYFAYGSGFTSANFPSLEVVRYSGFERGMQNNASLASVNMRNLLFVGGDGMNAAFENTAVQNLDLGNVIRVEGGGMRELLAYNTVVQSVDLSGVLAVGEGALSSAFYGCTSLQTVDMSNLKVFNGTDLQDMFYDNSQLQNVYLDNLMIVDCIDRGFISLPYTEIFGNTNPYYKIVVDDYAYDDYIQDQNWGSQDIAPHIVKRSNFVVSFMAATANSTISMASVGSAPSVGLEYSTDGGTNWSPFIVGSTTVTLANIGDEVLIRGSQHNNTFATDDQNYNKFVITGQVYGNGELGALVHPSNPQYVEEVNDYTLSYLFYGCSGLLTAPRVSYGFWGDYAFYHTFDSCTGLLTAPEIHPDITDWDYGALQYMFYGCTSMEYPPSVLRFNSDRQRIFKGMFKGCTNLKVAPVMLGENTGTGCFEEMFYGCTKLKKVCFPELTDISHADAMKNCFYGCTSLEKVVFPFLRSVGDGSYAMNETFSGCTSLKEVDFPSLSGVWTSDHLFEYTFKNCTSLKTVTMPNIYQFNSGNATGMFYGCTSLETIDFSIAAGVVELGNSTDTFSGASGFWCAYVPDRVVNDWKGGGHGWENYATHIYPASSMGKLKFRANTAGSTVKLQANGNAPSVNLLYSTDGSTWSAYTVGTTITLANVNDFVLFKAGPNGNSKMATAGQDYNSFVLTGSVAASGSVMCLLDENGGDTITETACFCHLLWKNSALTTAPELPATTLAQNCYEGMFEQCTSLTEAPYLPAINLPKNCYFWMLASCTALTSIKIAYQGNFNTGPLSPTYYWVYNLGQSGTFYYNGSSTARGISAIPTGWTVQKF